LGGKKTGGKEGMRGPRGKIGGRRRPKGKNRGLRSPKGKKRGGKKRARWAPPPKTGGAPFEKQFQKR
jgi:hypothetical protein